MKNMTRVLRESWRGEGGRKVIDFKSDGKTHRSQEGAENHLNGSRSPSCLQE